MTIYSVYTCYGIYWPYHIIGKYIVEFILYVIVLEKTVSYYIVKVGCLVFSVPIFA